MTCCLLPDTRVAAVYVCPTPNHGPQHLANALRFADSYRKNPSAYPYDFYVVSNGGPPSDAVRGQFDPLSAKYIIHDDSGMDIGAYQVAAASVDCDLMIFLGGSTYFKGQNWVNRCVASWKLHGDGVYGTMCNTGDMRFDVYPHIRTTGFWMPPALMRAYPEKVRSPDRRYPFEHGQNCLTQWCARQGLKVMIVTWQHEYEQSQWHGIVNGFHNGDQSAMIMGDRLSEPPYWPVP